MYLSKKTHNGSKVIYTSPFLVHVVTDKIPYFISAHGLVFMDLAVSLGSA
jgi:hypothetical protein